MVRIIIFSILFVFNTQAFADDDLFKSLSKESDNYVLDHDLLQQLKKPMQHGQFEEAKSFGRSLAFSQQQNFSPIKDELEINSDIHYEVLISDEMGLENIRAILSQIASSGYPVTFYIKGMLPTEKTLNDVFKRSFSYVQGIEPIPSLQLDPNRFENVSSVPFTRMIKGDNLLLSVHGVINPRWLNEQYDSGKRGYQEKQGETFPVTEISPTVVAMERAKSLDAESIIARAKDNYWRKIEFEYVPNAYKTQQRTFIPEIIIPSSITTPDGKVVAAAGKTLNLLETIPFTRQLIVFDATDPRQIEFVKNIEDHRSANTVLISTKFNRERKWEAINDVEAELQNSVYQLNNDLIKGFDIQVVPCIITADNDNKFFSIQEFDVRDLNEHHK
ncbi:hypothetical protein ABT56_18805 [Photobacterium aquae]|uniref:Conjugal transfer protein n=1 Tax=Photobacterium aquae TaxID=1195763 RepID=A0A0J1GUT3_9GAMM|nr:hypothetical protein [Photobacterium aquae]KLV03488.1 hypothetical protein ABT56_18805 [Photobacterium aquae]